MSVINGCRATATFQERLEPLAFLSKTLNPAKQKYST
jgi:hypothetical protein